LVQREVVACARSTATPEESRTAKRGRTVQRDVQGARSWANSPGTKWTAFNAVAEHLEYGRRYTTRTNQVRRSFEDTALKQRALELVAAA
jgi:hypothetical protein